MSGREAQGIPPLQIVWVIVAWLAVSQTLFLMVEAVTGGAAAYQIVIVALAASATVIGAIFATRVARARVTSTAFVKGTTTGRTIAVAWVLIGAALIIAPIASVLAGLDMSGLTSGIIGTVGSVSFIAILGPGYSEYRDALATGDAT